MSRTKLLRLLFGLEILALALYFWHQTISVFVGWEKNRLALHISILMAFMFLFALGLTSLLLVTARYLQTKTCLSISDLSCPFILSLSPVFLLYLIFLQYTVFLKDIRGYLLPISLAGIVYLFLTFTFRLKKTYPKAIPALEFLKKWNP